VTVDLQRRSDDGLVEQFERGAIAADSFHHADHVRLAYEYLSRYPAIEALQKFSDGLRRFAAAHGRADRYHETITWAYLFLIRERMACAGRSLTWEEFAAGNVDLLLWAKGSFGVLDLYYRAETLASPAARATFLLPDKSADIGRGATPCLGLRLV
jgi:hypothetical protein